MYKEGLDYDTMLRNVEAALEDYNGFSKKPMDLVIFRLGEMDTDNWHFDDCHDDDDDYVIIRYAIEHLARLTRVLNQPGGHALLVGLGGSGKHSLSRLATNMLDYDIYEVRFLSGV